MSEHGTPEDAGYIIFEFEGLGNSVIDDFGTIFFDEGEEIYTTSSFDGREAIAVIAKIAAGPLKRIFEYFNNRNVIPSKTRIKIGKTSIEISGFNYEQAMSILNSEAIVRAKSDITK